MRYVVDKDDPRVIEAESLTAAVEAYVHDHADDGWSDRFDVYARAESADHWTVFPVVTRAELIVTVGRSKLGPMVESDDEAAE